MTYTNPLAATPDIYCAPTSQLPLQCVVSASWMFLTLSLTPVSA